MMLLPESMMGFFSAYFFLAENHKNKCFSKSSKWTNI